MGFYNKKKYLISNHAIKRYSERTKKNISFNEILEEIYKEIENTYEGEILENGDKKLISYSCSETYFIVSKNNIVKTFWKKQK